MKSQQKIVIFSIIGLILFFIISGAIYKNQKSNDVVAMVKEDSALLERDYSVSIGNKDAKVHLVEFFDPACVTCADFHPLVKDIMKKNEGNIRLTLRYAPYHSGSDYIVKILEASRKQGKFNETLEMIFKKQLEWEGFSGPNMKVIWPLLSQIGLNIDQLVKDMKDPKLDDLIAQDLADAKKVGATKTPSYYVNGKPLQQFGYEQLKELIYSEL